ncbi:histidine kinase [Megamonas hypermegale]|nr:histidine kinase [Megamonas hypermegale]
MNMKKKIFHYMCFLISLSVICTFILTLTLCYPLFFKHTKQEVKDESVYITYLFNNNLSDPIQFLNDTHTQTRITWIDSDGNVLFDNSAEAANMENHLLRQEIQSALSTGVGEAYRISTTLGSNTYYYALKLNDGTILRLSRTNVSAYDMLQGSLPILFAMMLIIYAISLLAARRMARNIIAPINSINLEHPIMNDLYEELNPMLIRLENQNEQIRQQMKTLKNQQREFTAIINNIEEGLILVNHAYKILSVNHSALEILNADKINYIDKNLFTLVNNDILYQAIQSVMNGERQEFYFPMGEKTYQIIASPVTKRDKIKGALILFVDITEKRMAEKMRQEFSANVSHELKTPLTSISGFAELLQNNMVRPNDVPLFAGKIYKEAQRLINLVQDIIKVSQLDEKNSSFMKEPINLSAICKQTILYLSDKALKKQVKLNFTPTSGCEISAVRQLIDELVYNLIENAIKYNKPKGQVDILLSKDSNSVSLSVKDTGIGISKEDLPHVFERFYRADKSRSQIKVEGTGLGLAIVKHIAEYHHAKLSISSELDKGTTITIQFPLIKD